MRKIKVAWLSAMMLVMTLLLSSCGRTAKIETVLNPDYDISDKMTTYLCNFAKNGNPNGENQPIWNTYNSGKKVMHFGEGKTEMKNPSVLKLVKIMLTNKAVGE